MLKLAENKHLGIIAYLALILAITGVGIGLIPVILPSTAAPQEENIITGMWSSVGTSGFAVPQGMVVYIPNLLIDYTIAEGENSYFHFDAVLEFETPGLVQFVFLINDLSYPQSYTNVEYPSIGGSNVTVPVSFFYTLYAFTAGSHNVTVTVFSDSVATTVWFSRLLVQTFIEP